jgi:hypothetical protein
MQMDLLQGIIGIKLTHLVLIQMMRGITERLTPLSMLSSFNCNDGY